MVSKGLNTIAKAIGSFLSSGTPNSITLTMMIGSSLMAIHTMLHDRVTGSHFGRAVLAVLAECLFEHTRQLSSLGME